MGWGKASPQPSPKERELNKTQSSSPLGDLKGAKFSYSCQNS